MPAVKQGQAADGQARAVGRSRNSAAMLRRVDRRGTYNLAEGMDSDQSLLTRRSRGRLPEGNMTNDRKD